MKRIFLSACVFLILFAAGCKKNTDSDFYGSIYHPFTARVQVKIDSSEYSLIVEKGGANLISVKVEAPLSLQGMSFSLGEDEKLTFNKMDFSSCFTESIAHLFNFAFSEQNRTGIDYFGETANISFLAFGKEGIIYVDSFSKLPVSLSFGEITAEFCDFIG